VRLVLKDLPLRAHPRARDAAQAARCAGPAYWAYHDRLFAQQDRMERDDFLRHASVLGLEPRRFAACLDDEAVAAAIDRDVDEAHAIGVNATPSFVIDGRCCLVGAQPIETFRAVLDEALARKR
jgi:protein-disulfide isomerase